MIKLSETEAFISEYVLTQKPVIITDMFKGQEIKDVKGKKDALERWSNINLKVQLEYMETYNAIHDEKVVNKNPKNFEVREMSYAEYDNYVEKNRDT